MSQVGQPSRTSVRVDNSVVALLKSPKQNQRTGKKERISKEVSDDTAVPLNKLFKLMLSVGKHSKHQKELFHNFINFKKVRDRVWRDGESLKNTTSTTG